MDFITLYDKYHNLKINCNITDQFKVERVIFGSGGSNNIILAVTDKIENDKLIIKIIPDITYFNEKIKPNQDQLEINFYQFFTKKYILTNRTPHIVGIYNHQNCSQIDRLIKKIKNKKPCPSHEDQLTKKLKPDHINDKLCELLLQHEMKIVGPIYDVILLEYCPADLNGMIEWYIYKIKKPNKESLDDIINEFIYNLYRMLFQIIFTLAIIQEDYPGFAHGDFFVRNILISFENNHKDNEYVAYHYKQRIFYLPANGPYAKINDFGMSIIVNELEPNTYLLYKPLDKFYHRNPFNQKTDIFNLLHDIYDGQNIGTLSIYAWTHKLELPFTAIKSIRDFLNNFIKVNAIDKINTINGELLNETWNIDGIKILEGTVSTPNEYLSGNIFSELQILPTDAKIVRHFNEP